MSEAPHPEPRSTAEGIADRMLSVGCAMLGEQGAGPRSHLIVLVRVDPPPAGEQGATTAVLGFADDPELAQRRALSALLTHARRMAAAVGLNLSVVHTKRSRP
jgi:hypothetical protein